MFRDRCMNWVRGFGRFGAVVWIGAEVSSDLKQPRPLSLRVVDWESWQHSGDEVIEGRWKCRTDWGLIRWSLDLIGVLWIIRRAQRSVFRRGSRSAGLAVRSRGCSYTLIALCWCRIGLSGTSIREYRYLVCRGTGYCSWQGHLLYWYAVARWERNPAWWQDIWFLWNNASWVYSDWCF